MTQHPPPASRDLRPDAPGATSFSRRLMSVVAVLLLVAAVWQLSDLLILVFAASVFGLAIESVARQAQRWLRVPARWSVPVAVVLIVAALTGVSWAIGDPVLEQLNNLRERLPAAADAVMAWLHGHTFGQQLLDLWRQASRQDLPWGQLVSVATLTVATLGNLALVLVLAIYLAAAPGLYRRGLVRLIPGPYRGRVDEALATSATNLRKWLLGQAISMLFVGTATGLGLWALGMPLPLAQGLISGLLAFIPFIGAILGGLLAVLLAFMEGPQAALYVALLCLAIQQVEGSLLMPMVQRWAVDLPPVLGIVSSVVFGVLFGIVGVLFATPLMVVVMTLVKQLYVEGFLEADRVAA